MLPAYVYQKDEWALHRNLQRRKLFCTTPPPPVFSSLSLSLCSVFKVSRHTQSDGAVGALTGLNYQSGTSTPCSGRENSLCFRTCRPADCGAQLAGGMAGATFSQLPTSIYCRGRVARYFPILQYAFTLHLPCTASHWQAATLQAQTVQLFFRVRD